MLIADTWQIINARVNKHLKGGHPGEVIGSWV